MATRQLKHKANTQLKQKPKSLLITIQKDCTPTPNGLAARLSRSQRNGEPSTVYWYAKKDCCISFPIGALLGAPAGLLLDTGNYSILYTLNQNYPESKIRYNVVCTRPCPDHPVDNGESIIIDP
jgi:hypothetical protein